MYEPATCDHPLQIAGTQCACVAEVIFVRDLSVVGLAVPRSVDQRKRASKRAFAFPPANPPMIAAECSAGSKRAPYHCKRASDSLGSSFQCKLGSSTSECLALGLGDGLGKP